ncbi:Transposable element tcb1 transposase [Caligus rogercresseyi]|uniref:Transposable element tcb1 transposase n=1 Tax=Caligus rogercresseyi TaxID=217165 RepID=A0A7T8HGM3_CALRO|nr:Transposable element tcb1 transposase [Caligus rogercresseyi]
MSSEGDIMPPHFFAKGQNVNKEVYLDVMQTVVKPWMTQIAAGRPYLYQQDGAPAHTSNLVQNWCLENLDMFWSKEFRPPATLTSTPATPTYGPCSQHCGLLESCHHPGSGHLSREQVAHAVGRFRHRVEAVIVEGGSWIE